MLPSERDGRDVTEHAGRVFDVQPSRDDGALAYPVRPLLTALAQVEAEPLAPVARVWRRGAVLDQGREGACVGHGVTGDLISAPVPVRLTDANLPEGAPTTAQAMAFWLYKAAQRDDEWEGEAYSGTSVNAGMRVSRSLGLIDGWRWAETYEDFRDSLIHVGPVVIAIPWFSGMYDAPGGLLRVSGQEVGWHCLLANGWHPSLSVNGSPKTEKFRVLNSWSTSWGSYGSAWIDRTELFDNLLHARGGEMVVPLGPRLARLANAA